MRPKLPGGADGTLEAGTRIPLLDVGRAGGEVDDGVGVFIDGSLQMMQFLEDRVDGPFQVELRAVFSIEGRACPGGVVGEI